MTTPTTTPAQQAEAFREEIRRQFMMIEERLQDIAELTHENRANIINIGADLQQMREGLTQASQPTPTAVGTFGEMQIDLIVMSYDDNGKPTYKAKGAPYQKHGVRIWEEVIPALGIDPLTLHPGTNQLPAPIKARVLMGETTNRETGAVGIGPRKVTSKA